MFFVEFKKVLELFNIDYTEGESISWNGVNIKFDEHSAVVDNCPYHIIRILSEEYPLLNIFKNVKRDYLCIYFDDFYLRKGVKKKRNNTYSSLEPCHVHNIEALIYLLSEIRYFYEVRNYTEESRKALISEQKELLASAYRELIEEINPTCTTEEWKEKQNISDYDEYDEIRELVRQFDKTANPYINLDVEVKDPSEFMDKVHMALCYGNPYKGCKAESDYLSEFINYVYMHMEGGDLSASYMRYDNCLEYKLTYYDDNLLIGVEHRITEDSDKICLHVILIGPINVDDFFDKNDDEPVDRHDDELVDKNVDESKTLLNLSYDMKTGLVEYDSHPITKREKEIIIPILRNAIRVGQRIILESMTKKKNDVVNKL